MIPTTNVADISLIQSRRYNHKGSIDALSKYNRKNIFKIIIASKTKRYHAYIKHPLSHWENPRKAERNLPTTLRRYKRNIWNNPTKFFNFSYILEKQETSQIPILCAKHKHSRPNGTLVKFGINPTLNIIIGILLKKYKADSKNEYQRWRRLWFGYFRVRCWASFVRKRKRQTTNLHVSELQ